MARQGSGSSAAGHCMRRRATPLPARQRGHGPLRHVMAPATRWPCCSLERGWTAASVSSPCVLHADGLLLLSSAGTSHVSMLARPPHLVQPVKCCMEITGGGLWLPHVPHMTGACSCRADSHAATRCVLSLRAGILSPVRLFLPFLLTVLEPPPPWPTLGQPLRQSTCTTPTCHAP